MHVLFDIGQRRERYEKIKIARAFFILFIIVELDMFRI